MVKRTEEFMARRGSDVPETLVHILTVARSAEVDEQKVREKLRPGDIYEDWEGSPAVLRSKARELRAELIAERDARRLEAIAGNAAIDRQKRQAERERVEAAKRRRANVYSGIRVSEPGETPPDWMGMPSSGDE
jgi:hypothetical protein